MILRAATDADAEAVARIVNPYIRDTTVSFTEIEKTVDQVAQEIAVRQAEGKPFLVAQTDEGVVGYATYDQFRKGTGYGRTMEHTVMLASDARGHGVGRALIAALEDHAVKQGVGALMAGISGENTEAVTFHLALGYEQVGHVAQAGFKFGRWIDLILLQKRLSHGLDSR